MLSRKVNGEDEGDLGEPVGKLTIIFHKINNSNSNNNKNPVVTETEEIQRAESSQNSSAAQGSSLPKVAGSEQLIQQDKSTQSELILTANVEESKIVEDELAVTKINESESSSIKLNESFVESVRANQVAEEEKPREVPVEKRRRRK